MHLIADGVKLKFKAKISAVDPIISPSSLEILSLFMEVMMLKKESLEIFTQWISHKVAKNLYGNLITIFAKESR